MAVSLRLSRGVLRCRADFHPHKRAPNGRFYRLSLPFAPIMV
jgi:hypothetical protein